MSVNKHSAEFMFGQIMARLDEGDKDFDELKKDVKSVKKAVDDLPCMEHKKMIEDAVKWQTRHNGFTKERHQAVLSLKHGAIIAVVGSGAGVVFAYIASLFG